MTITISTQCPLCKAESTIDVDKEKYEAYLAGVDIKYALPELTRADMDRIVCGICPTCWANFFPED